jgi:hypothetical protein
MNDPKQTQSDSHALENSDLQQAVDELIVNPKSLRENLTELMIQHQRKNRLEWENDDYSDFFGLLMILDRI